MGLMSGKRGHLAPTEEEVMIMSRMAAKEGHLRPQEQRWVENALRLDRVHAADLMTPRTVVQSLPAGTSLRELETFERPWVHSRLPLTEGDDRDKILGLVYRREVFEALVAGKKDLTLSELMRPIDFIPEAMPGHRLLDKFIQEKKHMCAVVDEYGGFEGVVTLEDVLECLIGTEIVDEHDDIVDLQEFARERARRVHGLEAGSGTHADAPAPGE